MHVPTQLALTPLALLSPLLSLLTRHDTIACLPLVSPPCAALQAGDSSLTVRKIQTGGIEEVKHSKRAFFAESFCPRAIPLVVAMNAGYERCEGDDGAD